jgi:hypothetical protein
MNTIKNIHKLDQLGLSGKDKQRLEAGAALHRRMSNITFKILEVTDNAITLSVSQGRHLSANYADKKTLVTRTRELFQRFFPDKKIHPRVFAYEPNPVTLIDSRWVKNQMEDLGLGVTDVVNDTGIDKTNISAWANGTRPMSQPVKAMFYHYLKEKKARLQNRQHNS